LALPPHSGPITLDTFAAFAYNRDRVIAVFYSDDRQKNSTKQENVCSAFRLCNKIAFIIGLALQLDGGPFGLSKKNPPVKLEKQRKRPLLFCFLKMYGLVVIQLAR